MEERITLTASPATALGDAALAEFNAAAPSATPLATVSYPGGVTVTSTQITTEEDIIPRFVSNPTITTIKSGSWTDPTIWSLGRVPVSGDRVMIPANMTIQYATVGTARLNGLEIDGSLIFSTTVSTRLTVGNMTVMPTGTLQIGTPSNPLPATLKAELIIADQALNLATDPRQFGTGLIALGTVTIHGAAPSSTWLGLAAEPHAGDKVLTLANSVSGWQPGDTLVLPDTRQLSSNSPPQWEQVVVDHVVGNQVFLTKALQFNHLGARNTAGVLELLPDVALLNRNVVIRSENPQGTRGHVFFTARANIDVEYARFQDLGRTDGSKPLDSATFDANGNVTHLGTNQIGRYAVHFHHVMGPANATDTGYQFKFVGNTVDGSRKWAVAIHDTSFGLVDGNVVYNAQGAGFVTEEGTEIGNLFSNNITIRMQGTGDDGKTGTQVDDYGRGGSGFWFRRGGNVVTGNVAADNTYAGFVIDGYYSEELTLPNFRGADPAIPSQNTVTMTSPATLWMNNEAYGMSQYGLWAVFISGDLAYPQPSQVFQDFRVWNVNTAGVNMYYTKNVTLDNILVLEDKSVEDSDSGAFGIILRTYGDKSLVIQNTRIEGARIGIATPSADSSYAGVMKPTIIRNTILKNNVNILVDPPLDYLDGGNGNSLEIRDVSFTLVPLHRVSSTSDQSANISMQMRVSKGSNPYDSVAMTQPSIVKVYNYNQVAGDNFQVFYKEQSPSFVMPQTSTTLLSGLTTGTIGSPVAGLTNAQNWARFGIAVAGGIAPVGASASRAGIIGLIAPIQDTSSVQPRVVIVTPGTTMKINGTNQVRIRYNVIGDLPAGSQVYFMLDNGPAIPTTQDFLVYPSPGQHLLLGYIGDATGKKLPDTVSTVRIFVMGSPAAAATVAATPAADSLASSAGAAVASALTGFSGASQSAGAPVNIPVAAMSPILPAPPQDSASAVVAPDMEAIQTDALAGATPPLAVTDELLALLADANRGPQDRS